MEIQKIISVIGKVAYIKFKGQSERAVLLHLKEMRERSATKRAHTSNPYTSIYAFNLDKNIKINF